LLHVDRSPQELAVTTGAGAGAGAGAEVTGAGAGAVEVLPADASVLPVSAGTTVVITCRLMMRLTVTTGR
jgi:hypothetical protein